MKYDDIDYHSGVQDIPTEAHEDARATHIGMMLG